MTDAALRIHALPGVWKPHSDAQILGEVVRERQLAREADVLDVFTGSGVLAISAARSGARSVTAVDVSRRALLTTRFNARRNSVRVTTLRGDMFSALHGQSFDLILANPPYIPGSDQLPRRGIARAWEGGADGRRLVDRLCAEAAAHLRPGGSLLLVHSSLNGEAETLERLGAGGLPARVLVRRRGRLGPVGLGRLPLLRERGLLGDGEEEEMLVILATRAVG